MGHWVWAVATAVCGWTWTWTGCHRVVCGAGEAQIAVIDLLGMMAGVILSRDFIGVSRSRIVATFALVTSLEIFCVYNEIKR